MSQLGHSFNVSRISFRPAIRRIAVTVVSLTAPLILSVLAPTPAHAAKKPHDLDCHGVIVGGTYRNVRVEPGHWCGLTFATVTGNVTAVRPTAFQMATTRVAGNVKVTGATSNPNASSIPGLGTANVICSSAILGDVTITGSGKNAPWDLSSTNYPVVAANISTCLAQIYVGGDVTFNDNLGAPNAVGGATILGDLTCKRNGAFTSGVVLPFMKNGVHGKVSGQCAKYSQRGDNPKIVPGVPVWLRPKAQP